MIKKKYIVVLLLLLFLLPTTTLFAQTVVNDGNEINNDVEVFDEDLVVEEGAVINGDVAVFNGNAIISGTINGDLAVFNGTTTIYGTMGGDVAVFNADLIVESTALFPGDCFVFNGTLVNKGNGSYDCLLLPNVVPTGLMNQLGGDFTPNIGENFHPVPPIEHTGNRSNFESGVATAGVSSLFMGFIAFVIAAIFPHRLQRVSATVRKKPVAGGTVGLLTMFAVPILLTFLTLLSLLFTLVLIGLLGFPIVALMSFAYGAAIVLGWVGVGNAFGNWLAGKLKLNNQNLKTTAVLGTIVLTFALGVLGAIPFVFGESLLLALLVWVGLGSVMLTKLGKRPYPPHIDADFEIYIEPDAEKVTAVLETLPDDPNTLKQS